jgi:hypothetical protein
MNSWDRQKGETARAFAAFSEYRNLGPERSIEQVSQILSKSVQFLKRWSARWSWVERSALFDDHQRKITQDAFEKSMKADGEKWASRLKRQREEEFELAEMFLSRARQMLKFPLVKSKSEKSEDGHTTITEVEPANWTMDTSVRFSAMGHKLQRMALGLATDQVAHVGANGEPLPPGGTTALIFLPRNGREFNDPLAMPPAKESKPSVPDASSAPEGSGGVVPDS